ncbi:hypothetical protein J8F10_22575 [Gemmata sp. G18]|uniref:Uncharacterized protein n=1 Tax=Gemmata palustris TaxID=2822762 RepID=A0ABS5BWE0_9BACT|nr:hypothetical protein [Gemmata palustris]MBP3958051.1 hypothetical protein [Gemmata palustris]
MWNWTFTANGQPVGPAERIGDLCETLRATNYRDGILWLDLLYVAAPESPADEGTVARSAAPGSVAPRLPFRPLLQRWHPGPWCFSLHPSAGEDSN